MTPRARNNTIAGLVVVAFWLILVIPTIVKAETTTVDQTTNSTVTTNGNQTTTVKSPPPSAISPNVGGNNSDLCTISSSGALGTQILSLSLGATYTEANCLLLKKARILYTAGMKVASVSLLCQDPAIWLAMKNAGTYCPIDGLIGEQAKRAWEVRTEDIPMPEEQNEKTTVEKRDSAIKLMGVVASAFLFF